MKAPVTVTPNAMVEPVRHNNVHGKEEYYLKIWDSKGKSAMFVVGKKALESVEELLKTTKNEMAIKS